MAGCAKCGEPLGDGAPAASGALCKWCESERSIKDQQVRVPAYSPTQSGGGGGGGGMSTLTILRLILLAVGLFAAFAKHC